MTVPAIRRLHVFDAPRIRAHFRALDADSLRARFGASVGPDALARHADSVLGAGALPLGAFGDARLLALAELRPVPEAGPRSFEAAFSVEPARQNQGLGDALLSRVLAVARNRGIATLYMLCLPENRRMQKLARKHGAVLTLCPEQIAACLATPWPTPFTLTEEMAGEYRAYMRAMFSWAG